MMGSQMLVGNYVYYINDFDQLMLSCINNVVKFQSVNFVGFMFGVMYGFLNLMQFVGMFIMIGMNGVQGVLSVYSFGVNYV